MSENLRFEDLEECFNFICEMADEKYKDCADKDTAIAIDINNTPAITGPIKTFLTETYAMISKDMDAEKIKEIKDNCDISDELFEAVFNKK